MIFSPLFSYLFPPLRLSLGLAGDLGWGVARPKNQNDLKKNDLDLGWGVARPKNSNLNKNDLDLVGCQTFKFKFK